MTATKPAVTQAMSPARLQWIIDKAELNDSALTPWEIRFLDDMGMRLASSGDDVFISEKQAATLDRIAEKVA